MTTDVLEESARDLAAGEELLPGLRAWSLLGGGDHCESWLAWSEDLWSPVVVKLPRPDDVADADVWQDLSIEARTHAGVAHPGFQRLWSAELEGACPHLVLEYVEGPTLGSLKEQGSLTVPDVVLVGMQLAASLRYLHRHGLVHLDVKPGNAVVRQGRVVLLDLGLVTASGRVYARHDAPGTTAYMSPELYDEGRVGPEADVFALGTTLRELLAGAPPLPSLDALVGRMTAPDPGARPSDDDVLRCLHTELDAPGLWPDWATSSLGSR